MGTSALSTTFACVAKDDWPKKCEDTGSPSGVVRDVVPSLVRRPPKSSAKRFSQ
jgi:hypothetical protein